MEAVVDDDEVEADAREHREPLAEALADAHVGVVLLEAVAEDEILPLPLPGRADLGDERRRRREPEQRPIPEQREAQRAAGTQPDVEEARRRAGHGARRDERPPDRAERSRPRRRRVADHEVARVHVVVRVAVDEDGLAEELEHGVDGDAVGHAGGLDGRDVVERDRADGELLDHDALRGPLPEDLGEDDVRVGVAAVEVAPREDGREALAVVALDAHVELLRDHLAAWAGQERFNVAST